MLDFFLKKKWVTINEEGDIKKTSSCPKHYIFLTDETGIVKFYKKINNSFRGSLNETLLSPLQPNQLIDNE